MIPQTSCINAWIVDKLVFLLPSSFFRPGWLVCETSDIISTRETPSKPNRGLISHDRSSKHTWTFMNSTPLMNCIIKLIFTVFDSRQFTAVAVISGEKFWDKRTWPHNFTCLWPTETLASFISWGSVREVDNLMLVGVDGQVIWKMIEDLFKVKP